MSRLSEIVDLPSGHVIDELLSGDLAGGILLSAFPYHHTRAGELVLHITIEHGPNVETYCGNVL